MDLIMAVDPSIILGIKQFQAPDPIEQYTRGIGLQQLLGQQDVQQMQMQQARQSLDDENATRDAYRQSGGDSARLRALLTERGQYKPLQALDKMELDRREKESTIGKNTAQTGASNAATQAALAKQGRDMIATATPENYPSIVMQGKILGQQWANNAPPEFSPEWQRSNLTNADTWLAQNTPKYERVDLGGTVQVIDVNPNTNPAIKGTALDKTATPDALMTDTRARSEGAANRGLQISIANMVDARARQQMALGGRQFDSERGMIVNRQTGEATPVTSGGQPIQTTPKLTETEGKAAGMLQRAMRANDILNTLEDAGETNRGLIKQGVERVPFIGGGLAMSVNASPEFLGGPSSNQQKVEQARRDFVNAALRVESGAAISQSEFENAERQYFPMPGDSPEVIRQKRQSRQSELDALRIQGGKGSQRATPLPAAPKPADPKSMSDKQLLQGLGISG